MKFGAGAAREASPNPNFFHANPNFFKDNPNFFMCFLAHPNPNCFTLTITLIFSMLTLILIFSMRTLTLIFSC